MDTSRYDDSADEGGMEPTIAGDDGEHSAEPADPIRTQPLDRGDSLGRYTVLDRIGSGGMGIVYAAYDPQLDRRVALKVLHPGADLEPGTSDGRGRLLREAQAMAKLSHPNVITVHDVGTLGDRVFVAMEFIDGATLREWLKQSHREWADVVEAFVKAGRGLAAAHAAGLVHRDFKPDNVLIGRDGRVLVMDFGLARHTASSPVAETISVERVDALAQPHDLVLTRTGALLGTPAYMAPEQHKGAAADPLADQFSFCVALYEALYGERPFSGTSVTSIAMAILEGRVNNPPKGSRVPIWLREVVVRGLSVAPGERYASMDALLAELQRDPPQPKRPWLGIGIATVVAGLITGGYLWSRPARADRCVGAADAFAEVWNDARHHAIAERFGATLVPAGESTADVLHGVLHDWGRQWVQTHDDACIASRVPGTGTITGDEVPELRCLDVMRGQALALVEALGDPDEAAVQRAVAAAQHLPPPARCVSRLRLSASEQARVSTASTRERVALTRRQLAHAWAQGELDRLDSALESADAARRSARATEDPGLEAEVDLVLAAIHRHDGRDDDAERALGSAVLHGAQGGRAGLEAEAWTALVEIVGRQRGRYGEGVRLGLAAEAAIARAGDDPLLQAALDHSLGRIHLVGGRWEEARSRFERARRARASLLPAEHVDLADTLLGLGLALEGLARFDQAAAHHADALAILEHSLGPRHPRVALALALLGTAELGADASMRADANFARARIILEPGEDVPTGARSDRRRERALADVLDRAGQVRRSDQRFDDAAEMHRRALELLASVGTSAHRELGYARLNLGVALSDRGRHREAVIELREALRIWESSMPATHPDLGLAHLDLGNALWALSEHEPARRAYASALEIWQDTLPDDNPRLGYALNGLGRCALALGDVDAAIDHLERALEIRDHDDEDKLNIAETCFTLARALWATGRDPERALVLVARARDLAGASEPFEEEDGLRAMLDGVSVPRFAESLVPAGFGTTNRDLPDF